VWGFIGESERSNHQVQDREAEVVWIQIHSSIIVLGAGAFDAPKDRDAHATFVLATDGAMGQTYVPAGGGPQIFSFDADFFTWWRDQIPMIEDFPYVRIDFRGDTDLVLLEGAQWDVTCISSKNVTL
jgi:hypothetical protein